MVVSLVAVSPPEAAMRPGNTRAAGAAVSHLTGRCGPVPSCEAGRTEGKRDATQAGVAALRAEAARLRDEVLAERERANTGLIRVAEAARLREAMVAERERANAALERALEAEARPAPRARGR